ncbi:IS66 family transposase [Lacticaseibacillus paracasei]|nr:IS66 family transposase [Lacticaseibacillus paracasei]MCZ2766913.1 transposase [Lacticaseibacillus paracasei]MCZ2769832.1 transposase [Lacticaseibacillus paracasei]MCZ2775338.1 transposase [Lacticaseibacillus paracasei]MCZ2778264.1 transposase [Lacticaseibacillus paracasei]MCZ2784511.1 transposase [Lacticaseibacillus paracasei]
MHCKKRQDKFKTELSIFYAWCESTNTLPQSKLGRAIAYALSQREVMENVSLDGLLEISNNCVK